MKKQTIKFHPRLTPAISRLNIWLDEKKHWPQGINGSSGSGKTHFVKEYLSSLGIDFIFCTVPDSGSYKKHVINQISSYGAALRDAVDNLDHTVNELEHMGQKKELAEILELDSTPYVIIDECHRFFSELENGIETLQHEKKILTLDEEENISIPYNRLILISHSGIGKNNSENTRLSGSITIPTPNRHEIVEVLMDMGFSQKKAVWSASHAKSNFRSALDVSASYNTPAAETYLPRGLEPNDIAVLWFYFRTDPAVNSDHLIPESEKLIRGTNALNNCSAFLGLDSNAIKSSEANLKEEGFLSTGTQSKRIISNNPETYKRVLAVLKMSGKFNNPEKEKEKQEKPKKETPKKTPEKSQSKSKKETQSKQPSKAKPSAKSKAKSKAQTSAKPKQPSKAQTKSKAPKMTGKSKASEIANEINSDKLKQPDLLDKVAE